MNIAAALLALSVLILIHELGHFIAAKLSGVKVLEFSIFMGPKLFSVKRGDTLYSFRLIPMGGYVRMEGEEKSSDDDKAFNNKPVWIRMIIIAAGPAMNILLAIIIFLAIIARSGFSTTDIDNVITGGAAEKAGITAGDRLAEYGGKSILHPMDLEIFSYVMDDEPVQVLVDRNGEKLEFTLIPQRFRYILGFIPKEAAGTESNVVGGILETSPAGTAGMKAGDRIIALNDVTVATRQDIFDFMEENLDEKVSVAVRRENGTEDILEVMPIKERNPEYYAAGIYFESGKGGLFKSLWHACIYSFSLARSVYYSIFWLISGAVSLSSMTGPIGIVTIMGDVAGQGPTLLEKFMNLLGISAFISINLGLFNLIPFPALDGSKILIYAIEAVRKKAIPPEKEALISIIGFVFLILLMIFTTYNDLLKQFGGAGGNGGG